MESFLNTSIIALLDKAIPLICCHHNKHLIYGKQAIELEIGDLISVMKTYEYALSFASPIVIGDDVFKVELCKKLHDFVLMLIDDVFQPDKHNRLMIDNTRMSSTNSLIITYWFDGTHRFLLPPIEELEGPCTYVYADSHVHVCHPGFK